MISLKNNFFVLFLLLAVLSLFSRIVLSDCPASSTNDIFVVNDNSNILATFTDKGNITIKGTCNINPSCNSGIFEVKSNGLIVASINSSGDLCLESGDCNSISLSCPEGLFNIKNSLASIVSSINSSGGLCLTGSLSSCACTPYYYNNCDSTDGCGATRSTSPYNSCSLTSATSCDTETTCNDGIDNDCDIELDYDSQIWSGGAVLYSGYHLGRHGDNNCAIQVKKINITKGLVH